MSQIKVVSFDAEGTLTTPRYSEIIWNEAIPMLYARKMGLGFEEARQQVLTEYQKIGPQRVEWYHIKHWFRVFGLSDYQGLLSSYRREIAFYPEVKDVLSSLSQTHELIIISNSAREFLDLLLEGIKDQFSQIFSAVSDFGALKSANLYLKICQALQIQPQEMAYVGDSWDFDFAIPRGVGIRAFYLDRSGEKSSHEVVQDLKEFREKLLALEH